MRLEVHVHVHSPDAKDMLEAVLKLKESIMSAMSDLQREVEEQATVHESAVALLKGLKTRLDEVIANGGDRAALEKLAKDLDRRTNDLAAAVTANTPSEPTPAPVEPTPAPVEPTPTPETPAQPDPASPVLDTNNADALSRRR